MSQLTHLDESGRVRMVDVSDKKVTARTARAVGSLTCLPATLDQVRAGTTPRGGDRHGRTGGHHGREADGRTHPALSSSSLTKAEVAIEMDDAMPGFRIGAEVRTNGVTGVEMEALTAVSVACLTLFDMLKAIDRTMIIGGIEVAGKSGGKSGDWDRSGQS
ncbi:cyclic pyranopterin monophosphate synthase MoaC [Sphingomonas daechungensis]|uniref:cyclic pyranopterin monophosphate synthase MoaC n=1 Tax=Sphingomonas daechungensis TaxID=1176646 RepID=UPI001CB8C630|nr:cyclic pyranopterin monophosphate synthase MoaC [Sphingomonas daechungensis]